CFRRARALRGAAVVVGRQQEFHALTVAVVDRDRDQAGLRPVDSREEAARFTQPREGLTRWHVESRARRTAASASWEALVSRGSIVRMNGSECADKKGSSVVAPLLAVSRSLLVFRERGRSRHTPVISTGYTRRQLGQKKVVRDVPGRIFNVVRLRSSV